MRLCDAVSWQRWGMPEIVLLAGEVVLVLDTIGDLASVYSVGAVAFIGGSLVAKGGHNPLEPAQFGVPVVMGQSYENFREIVGAMRDADAIRIVGRDELAWGFGGVDDGSCGGRGDGRAGARGV